ncbi:hypothetical protein C5167_029363 [Papaver somniferum]|nr:hypothetical protein C5167_029363 [Papaver somniferum]
MNRVLTQEMLHCMQASSTSENHNNNYRFSNGTDLTVLERQRARQKWQQQQHQQQETEAPQTYLSNDAHFDNLFQLPLTTSNFDHHQGFMNDSVMREFVNRSMKTDPSLENGWSADFGKYPVPKTGFGEEIITTGFSSTSNGFVSNNINSGNEMSNISISRTTSCPPMVGDTVLPATIVAAAAEEKSKEICSPGKMSSIVGRKRKADKAHNSKVNGVAEELRDKRIKVDMAEEVRREKISERMKYLQDLVPGCNKITGKAGMLDEIINYVQSLQRQVEFLSMKLATVNPRLDVNIDNFFAKDMFPSSGVFPNMGMLNADMVNSSTYLQSFNPTMQEMISSRGLDMVINPPEMAADLRRTISAPPLPLPDEFLDTSCFTQDQPTSTTWETDLQNIYSMVEFPHGRARLSVFPHQSYTGSMEGNNLKMEM